MPGEYRSGSKGRGGAGRHLERPGVIPDAAKFQRMNAVYTSYFKDPRPTRTTVVVAGLLGPGNIEIRVTARKLVRDVEINRRLQCLTIF